MTIIHELELENKDNVGLIFKTWGGKKKPKQNSYCWHNGKLAWVPKHSFKIKLGNTKDESRKHELQKLPK